MLGVDGLEVGALLQIGQQLFGVLIVHSDLLGEDGGRLVRFGALRQADHALLAGVFGALERKDTRRRCAVFREEVCLHLALWEVLTENARANLLTQSLDQGDSSSLVITLTQVLFLDEFIVVDQLHVGTFAESLA